MNKHQLESEIERKHCALARANGWFVEKIILAGRSGFPDRIYIKNGRVVFIEFKRPKGRTTKQQLHRHKELRDAGAEVRIVYSLAEAELVLRMDNVFGGNPNTSTVAF